MDYASSGQLSTIASKEDCFKLTTHFSVSYPYSVVKVIGIKLCLQGSQTITYPLQILIARELSCRCRSSVILMVELPALFRARVIMIVTSRGEKDAVGMFVTRKHVFSFQIKGRQ